MAWFAHARLRANRYNTNDYLSQLAELAIAADFSFVSYETTSSLHVSVRPSCRLFACCSPFCGCFCHDRLCLNVACQSDIDLIFVLDASNSISDGHFIQEKGKNLGIWCCLVFFHHSIGALLLRVHQISGSLLLSCRCRGCSKSNGLACIQLDY